MEKKANKNDQAYLNTNSDRSLCLSSNSLISRQIIRNQTGDLYLCTCLKSNFILKILEMEKKPIVLPVKYTSDPFCIQNISEQDDSIYIHTDGNLKQIANNICQHCHVFTKGETECWRIQVCRASNAGYVRSKTSEEFYYHTDHSFSKYPPEYLVLFCEHSDRMGGGISNMIALSTLLNRLSSKSIEALQQPVYKFSMPFEFNAPYMQGYTEGKLPILYKDLQGQLIIRYRYDIISKQGLPQDNLNALEELREIVETQIPISLLLKDNESIYFNNGKYLHARTEIKDLDRLLYRIMFNRRIEIKGDIYQQFDLKQNARSLTQKYIQEFKDMTNMQELPFEEDVFHSDMIEFSKQFNGLEFLQRCLYTFYRAIVHLYDQDSEMGQKTRDILEWPTKVEKMLRGLNQKKKFLPHFYRPDFILHKDEITGKYGLKICEVNARFATNGYIISLILNEILCKSTKKIQGSKNFKVVVDAILKEFANEEQIYFITNLTKLWDPNLLPEILRQKAGRKIIFIGTEDLSTSGPKLFCKSTQRVVYNAILELKQEEIMEMPQDVFEALAYETHCINDLRSIFICHDKRLLSIIHDPEFYDFLRNKYLQNSELDFLRAHTVKTWNKHCTYMVEQSIKNREKFVLKVPHEGKSEKMLFGFECQLEEWKNYIQSMNTFILQVYVPCKKMPIVDIHDLKQKTNLYTTVGTFLCFGDEMWGMGIFRCGSGAGVCLSNNGFFLGARIMPINCKETEKSSIIQVSH